MLDEVAIVTHHKKVNPNKAFFCPPSCQAYTHPMVKSLFMACCYSRHKSVHVSVRKRQAEAALAHCLNTKGTWVYN